MNADPRFCTFYLDCLWFGIAVEKVREVISSPTITPVPLARRGIAGLINLRGQIVTVIDLPLRLGFPERPGFTPPAIVVLHSENPLAGFLVDELGEVVEAPRSTCEAAPDNLAGELRQLAPIVSKFPAQLLHLLDVDKALGATEEGSNPGRQ